MYHKTRSKSKKSIFIQTVPSKSDGHFANQSFQEKHLKRKIIISRDGEQSFEASRKNYGTTTSGEGQSVCKNKFPQVGNK